MSGQELIVLLNGRTAGIVTRGRNGRFRFAYDDEWRTAEGAYPLSLSMPLTATEHSHRCIEAFLWGLLPDNAQVLDRWARRFQVSARNPFALMSHVGEDCAGAVQFIRPDRLNAIRGRGGADIEWLKEADIAQRLRTLRVDHAAWRSPGDTGQFSLAGAQPKTALLLVNGRWGVPSGRIPTTHILKPPTGEFDGHAENEHVCLRLASGLGLIAANSAVMHFRDEVAIVIERYDRQRTHGHILRVHQEDLCQALAILPTSKYENEGGPGVKAAVELIRTVSTSAHADVQGFLDAIAFNWIIGGTDAHAKNYSLLIGAEGHARLAPLYDVASILPYDFDFQRIRFAMKIGGKYRLRDIGLRQWHNLAGELRMDRDKITARIRDLAVNLLDLLPAIAKDAKKDGLDHPLIKKLAGKLEARARHCLRLLRA
jgi:serine/threonine-protein kinase HipA